MVMINMLLMISSMIIAMLEIILTMKIIDKITITNNDNIGITYYYYRYSNEHTKITYSWAEYYHVV